MALLLVSFAGMAQDGAKARPSLGIRAGYNLSGIYEFMEFKSDDGMEWKSGVNLGVVADFALSEKFLFRPGLYYSMKGFKDDGSGSKFSYNYLEAPLLAVYQHPLGESLKLDLQLGPYLGIGVGGKSEIGGLPEFDTFGGDDGEGRFDWGLNIGCGLQLGKIYAGVSFEDGFVSYGHQSKHHCLMLDLGYTF